MSKLLLTLTTLFIFSINTAFGQSATEQIVCDGESITLTSSPPFLYTVEWQVSTTSSTTGFTAAPGTNSSSDYSFIASPEDNGKYFRAQYYLLGFIADGNSAPVKLTVNPALTAPTTEDVARCGAGAVTLTASGASNGNYRWYTSQTGNSEISGERNATYTTPRLTSTRTYYVAITNGRCESARFPVTAFVHPNSNPPTISNIALCSGNTATLSVNSPVNGAVYNWYTTTAGGTPFHAGTSYTTAGLTASTTYYVEATTGCGTSSRRTVTVTVNPSPAAPQVDHGARCGNGTVTLRASGTTNGNYRWYTDATGGTAIRNATSAAYTTTSLTTTTTYYVAIRNAAGCESTRTPVTATVNPTPAAPSVTGASRVNAGTLTLTAAGAALGDSYRWYTQATGGTALAGATEATFTTPSISATTDYWVSVVSPQNCESTRTRVRAAITSVPRTGNLTTHVILFHENFSGHPGQARGMGAIGWDLTPANDNTTRAAQSSGGPHIRTNSTGDKTLTLDPVSTVGYEQIGIMFAHRRSNTTGNAPTLQYSVDGTNWSTVTGVGYASTSWNWASTNYLFLPENASNAANLRFRWQNTSSTSSRYYALDDITIIGTPVIGLSKFSWSERPNGENPFTASVSNPGAYTVDDVHLKWSRETNVTTSVGGTATGVSYTQFQSTPTLALMQTGANATNNRTIVTLELSRTVEDLTFTLFDVDRASGQFRDDIEILGYNGNTLVPLTKKHVMTTYIQEFTSNRIIASDQYGDVATNSKDGDVTITFLQAVDRIVITYRNASGTGNQGIAIHDLMWRKYDTSITPLPVELLSFKATTQHNQVRLNWSTASELNNDRFEVERSQDGRTFTLIGTVQGKGTSSLLNNYSFSDNNPGTGTNYYRLRQVDLDGIFEYSKTVATNIKAITIAVKAYPNPFQDHVRIELATEVKEKVLVRILDIQGRVILERQISIEGRYTAFELPTQELAVGVYFLHIKGVHLEAISKLLKQR